MPARCACVRHIACYSVGSYENFYSACAFPKSIVENPHFFCAYWLLPILAFHEQGNGKEPKATINGLVCEENVYFAALSEIYDIANGRKNPGNRAEDETNQIFNGAATFTGFRSRRHAGSGELHVPPR